MIKSHKRLILLFILMIAVAFSRPFSAADVYADDADGALEIEGSRESFIPDADDEADNDELFDGYIERELNEALPSSGKRLLRAARPRLQGANLAVYNKLKSEIAEVADGSRTSTVFTVSLADLALAKNGWTASDLGVNNIVKEGYITDEASEAVFREIGFDLKTVIDALIADCPYDLYWYDKTASTFMDGVQYSYWASREQIALSTGITFYLPVAQGYAASTYAVDASNGQRVRQAVANAKSIVADSYGTDHERLIAYRKAICKLADYDYDAVYYNSPYGDPWQLVSVFDGDPYTNVVCEGYAKAFQYLCDLSSFEGDISCISVSGTMSGGTGAGSHMWNIVTMEDGFNYLVDLTNCDEGAVGADDLLFLVGSGRGNADSGYYFLNNSLVYSYDSDTRRIFSAELHIADHDYINKDENPCTGGAEHVFGDWNHVSDSTCVEHGEDSRTCKNCHLTIYRSIELKDHEWGDSEYDPKPTCSSYGRRHIYCKICHEEKVNEVAPKLAHTMGSWTTVKEPTYDEAGIKKRSCEVCGYAETEEIAILARTSVANANVSNIKVKVYTGKALKQSPVVKVGGKTLKSGTDYTLTYSKNKNVGIATVKISGKGVYNGSISKTFKIRPRSTVLKTVTPLKKGFTAKWTKKLTQNTGYQLQYSTSKNFSKNKKTKTITKKSKTSRKVTGLKAKKKYYVRVRTYKTVSGKKYYSKWSKVKTVTTKR